MNIYIYLSKWKLNKNLNILFYGYKNYTSNQKKLTDKTASVFDDLIIIFLLKYSNNLKFNPLAYYKYFFIFQYNKVYLFNVFVFFTLI